MKTELYQMVEGRHGRFLANPQDLYMGRSMIAYGEFSEVEWVLLDQIVRPGSVVIEAGTNMGTFTVPLAKKVGRGGMVYAFEPQLMIFQQMCANLALNDLVNVQAFNAGCGAKPGWLPIKRINPARVANFGGLSLAALKSKQQQTKVRIEALDEVLDPPALHLLKADVEGMELDVLRGAAGLIAKHRPLMYLEAHDPTLTPDLFKAVFDLDYRMFWHQPPMFSPKNFFGNTNNMFNTIVSRNVLCVPSGNGVTITGAKEVSGVDDHPKNWDTVVGTSG